MSEAALPLCVDLDGTLIDSDLLLESFLLLLKRNPLYLFLMPLWLLRGKAVLKAEIARRVALNAAALPYDKALVHWLREQNAAGRPIWLCTASHGSFASAVAAHLKLFTGTIASDEQRNLSGSQKAAELVARFGERGFDYIGNEAVDLAVWRHARHALVASSDQALAQRAGSVATLERSFDKPRPGWRAVAKALRIHQWAKNALIFVPVLAAHRLSQGEALGAAALAFVAFSLCASSVYLLNDMLDLEADRQHPRKSRRPFASGSLPLLFGLVAAPLLLLVALGLTVWLPLKFLIVLGTYYAATLAYSFVLKQLPMIDVLSLAGLYTIRIVAGAAATAIPLSFWLLLFSTFLFLSLAMVKRNAELIVLQKQGSLKTKGRGYHVDDLPLIQSLGTAAGYLSVLVLALYINSPEISTLYKQPKMIWLLCPLVLYWTSRIWMQTHRGFMHDDPVIFAMKDRTSLVVVALCGLVLWLAI